MIDNTIISKILGRNTIRFSFARPSACPAMPSISFIDIRIALGKFVTIFAKFHETLKTALDVFAARHQFHMIRIDTISNSAEVIDNQSIGNRASINRVTESMGQNRFFIDHNLAVTMAEAGRPQPAIFPIWPTEFCKKSFHAREVPWNTIGVKDWTGAGPSVVTP